MKRNTKQFISVALSLVLASLALAALAQEKARTPQNDPALAKRTAWWRDAKFGMFIHWGLYAVPAGYYHGKPADGAGEWIMNTQHIPIAEYEKFAPRFNPKRFNAREWARIAKNAGMKYMVITSKHHEGFSMFDTAVNRYNIVDGTPYRKDPMKDLAKACKAEGVKFGFYHSIMDWHHPELMGDNVKEADVDRYVNGQLKPQLKELIVKYDPAVLWFDGEWVNWWTEARGQDLERYLRSLKPDVVINNRIGKRGLVDGDYETPEQEIPAGALGNGRLWETCMTMNDTWGWKKDDHNWKSVPDLTHKLVDIASKGGNFLLNVGPTETGLIPGPSVERLSAMGRWMKANGASIYGTTKSPYNRTPFDGRCTVKGNTLYVHAFTWPAEGVKLTGLKSVPVAAKLLDGGSRVSYRTETGEDGMTTLVLMKPSRIDPLDTVTAVTFREAPQAATVVPKVQADASGVLTLRAADAEVRGGTAHLQGSGEDANIGYWTNKEDSVSWIAQVDKPGTYGVEIRYACEPGSDGSRYAVFASSLETIPTVGQPIDNDNNVGGTVANTGSWNTFKTERIGGGLQLKPGRNKITVQPFLKPGLAVMNLASVRLIPER